MGDLQEEEEEDGCRRIAGLLLLCARRFGIGGMGEVPTRMDVATGY